jgi:hypothetical protein
MLFHWLVGSAISIKEAFHNKQLNQGGGNEEYYFYYSCPFYFVL